jgi:sRNA-binding regulator protein Hfq
MDKSKIYFSNGKKIAGKRVEFGQREVISFFTLVTNKGEHSIIYSK